MINPKQVEANPSMLNFRCVAEGAHFRLYRIRQIVREGRNVDELVQRLVPYPEIQRSNGMASRCQLVGDLAEMLSLEEDGWPIVDRPLVVEEIELGGVNRDPSRAERIDRIADERQAFLDRPKVLKRADRPAEIEVPQVIRDGIHIHIAKADMAIEGFPVYEVRHEQAIDGGGVLV